MPDYVNPQITDAVTQTNVRIAEILGVTKPPYP